MLNNPTSITTATSTTTSAIQEKMREKDKLFKTKHIK